MSSAAPSSRVRRRDDDDNQQPEETSRSREGDQAAVAAGVVSQPSSAADPGGAQPLQSADVQALPEQSGPRKKPRRSARLACHLDKLAVVELQLCLQFLDTKSKLIAARCSRSLLQAADHPFAWRGPSVAFGLTSRPQLSSLLRQSLLRHAPIALSLLTDSELAAAEVAAIPRLRELIVSAGSSADLLLKLLALPTQQGLQTLQVQCRLPQSALRLLSSLPALHTLGCSKIDGCADWSWLPAMSALTDLDLQLWHGRPFPQLMLDAIGQCAQLRSLRLRCSRFEGGAFARLCSSPALRQLSHLELDGSTFGLAASEEFPADAFSALARLESLRLKDVNGMDLLLANLDHAPALRTLTIACTPDELNLKRAYGPTHPSCAVLRRLLTAAPRLGVRLEVAASIEQWRDCWLYHVSFVSASHRERFDEQWRELQRMGTELERVTIVNP